MNKNMIRKPLAIGSAALLGASVFTAVAPAYAAGELKLEAASGVGYAVPHGVDFGLKASVTAGNDSDELQFLKYKITTAGGVNVRAISEDTAVAATSSTSIITGDDETADTLAAGEYSTGEATNFIGLYIQDATPADFAVTDDNVEVTVTAFIDKDGDDLVDSDEWQTAQTVTWMDNSNYDFVNVLDQPAVGDAQLEGEIRSATMNLDQSIAALNVDFTESSSLSGTSVDEAPTYDAVDNELDYISTFTGSIDSAGGTFSAILQTGSTDIATSTRAVSSTTVNNINVSVAATANSTALSSAAFELKSGSGSFTVAGVVEDSSDDPIKDKTVTLRIAEDTINELNSDASFTVGGNTLSNDDATTAEFATATAVSDGLGKVSFEVSYAGVKKTEAVDITLDVDGITDLQDSSDSNISDTLTATAEDAAATTLYSADVIANDEEMVVATDAAFSLNYHVMDQFGQLFTGSGLTVEVTHNSDTFTGAVSGGTAKVDFSGFDEDNDGKLAMNADVTSAGTDPSVADITTEVFVGSVNDVSTITLAGTYGTASSKTALNTEDTANADLRFGTATDAPDNEIADVTATLTDSNGNTVRGEVTFSGTNLMFEGGSGTVFSKGSITVMTDENGVADVDVSSQYAGTQTMTVTAGGVSKTQDIVFEDAAATSGTSLEISAPDNVQAGATAQIVATLSDKFGNPVQVTDSDDISVTYSGPGIAFPSTLPTTTDSSGQAKFAVLMGNNDSGTGTVTVSYDQSSDGDFTGTLAGDLDLVVAKSFTVGEGTFTGTYGTMSAWTVNQDDGTAKVYVKFPTIGEKVRIGHQTGGSGSYETIYVKTTTSETMDGLRQVAGVGTYVVRTIDLESGTNRIRVTVGDSTEVQVRYNE